MGKVGRLESSGKILGANYEEGSSTGSILVSSCK